MQAQPVYGTMPTPQNVDVGRVKRTNLLKWRVNSDGEATENVTHHGDKFQGAGIADAVEHAVGVLAGAQHTFVTHDGQMLGNIALGCTNLLDDVLHADFFVTENAEDLQTQRMRHRLHCPRRLFDLLVLIH